jgi:glutaredoxin 3
LAKKLLESKGQTWQEVNLTEQPEKTDEMLQRANGKMTVPEIFINDQLIGGYDDLVALEKAGKLDALLAD